MKKSTLTLLLSSFCLSVWAGSFETLPKGVNMFLAKQVMTSKIESKYNAKEQDNSLSLKESFNSNKLENISSAFKSYFEELRAISPDAYEKFSLGEFEANAHANVNAQALALAHGITDRLTVYGSLPIYHMKTTVSFVQNKKSNVAAVQGAILNSPTTSAVSTFIKQLTLQLPETNEELMQSLIVNYYGYKPLGTWEKDALGDAEVGLMYRLTDFPDMGMAITLGATLPTGESDDPDSLQDISTGDRQYDAFIENNSGISFFDNSLALDLKTRFTYQFASKKTMRTIESADVPLSRTKEEMKEKLGNKLDGALTLTLNVTNWLNLNSSYLVSTQDKSTYGASDPRVKQVLENDSSSHTQWAKAGIGLSTVELYKRKKFDIPFEINLSAQKLLGAKNTANYERYDLDLRLYF